MIIIPTLFHSGLCDVDFPLKTVGLSKAEELFIFFKHHSLFNWQDDNNGCEGRADAVCVLLDEWNIPNYKAWVFSGAYLHKHVGQLIQNWNYHVAPVLAVEQDGKVITYVLDPATGDRLQPVEEWAAAITQLPHSYHGIRQSHWYIFPAKNIPADTWNTRNRQNRKWMIQCIAGINGLTKTGKAKLCFNKQKIKKIAAAFEQAKRQGPK